MRIRLFSVMALLGGIINTGNATMLVSHEAAPKDDNAKFMAEAVKKFASPHSKIKELGKVGDPKNPATVFEIEDPKSKDDGGKIKNAEMQLE